MYSLVSVLVTRILPGPPGLPRKCSESRVASPSGIYTPLASFIFVDQIEADVVRSTPRRKADRRVPAVVRVRRAADQKGARQKLSNSHRSATHCVIALTEILSGVSAWPWPQRYGPFEIKESPVSYDIPRPPFYIFTSSIRSSSHLSSPLTSHSGRIHTQRPCSLEEPPCVLRKQSRRDTRTHSLKCVMQQRMTRLPHPLGS